MRVRRRHVVREHLRVEARHVFDQAHHAAVQVGPALHAIYFRLRGRHKLRLHHLHNALAHRRQALDERHVERVHILVIAHVLAQLNEVTQYRNTITTILCGALVALGFVLCGGGQGGAHELRKLRRALGERPRKADVKRRAAFHFPCHIGAECQHIRQQLNEIALFFNLVFDVGGGVTTPALAAAFALLLGCAALPGYRRGVAVARIHRAPARHRVAARDRARGAGARNRHHAHKLPPAGVIAHGDGGGAIRHEVTAARIRPIAAPACTRAWRAPAAAVHSDRNRFVRGDRIHRCADGLQVGHCRRPRAGRGVLDARRAGLRLADDFVLLFFRRSNHGVLFFLRGGGFLTRSGVGEVDLQLRGFVNRARGLVVLLL